MHSCVFCAIVRGEAPARAAQPANVDTVMVDGRILKRAGKLTAMNAAQIAVEAAAANLALRRRANWW